MSDCDKNVSVHVGGVWKQWKDEREHMIGEIINLKKELKNMSVNYDEQMKLMDSIRQVNIDLTEKNKQFVIINKDFEKENEKLSMQLTETLQKLNVYILKNNIIHFRN